ncbi:hypothetical protein CHH52_09810 [Shouchella clausii]|nr:hypothetical protein CHH52_09810 [Shouchella clausii]
MATLFYTLLTRIEVANPSTTNRLAIYRKDLLQGENRSVRKGIKQEVEVIIVALKIECDVFA